MLIQLIHTIMNIGLNKHDHDYLDVPILLKKTGIRI